MEGIIYDELKVYRGEDYAVNDKITVRQPTLGEICDYGEREYYAMISTLTSSPADMKWQFWQVGCDYTTLSGDFELFYKYLIFGCSKERTSIVLGDLDFFKFVPIEDKDGSVTGKYQRMRLQSKSLSRMQETSIF